MSNAIILVFWFTVELTLMIFLIWSVKKYESWGEFLTIPKCKRDSFWHCFSNAWKQPVGRYRAVTAHTIWEMELRMSRLTGLWWSRAWICVLSAKFTAMIREGLDPEGETGIIYYFERKENE